MLGYSGSSIPPIRRHIAGAPFRYPCLRDRLAFAWLFTLDDVIAGHSGIETLHDRSGNNMHLDGVMVAGDFNFRQPSLIHKGLTVCRSASNGVNDTFRRQNNVLPIFEPLVVNDWTLFARASFSNFAHDDNNILSWGTSSDHAIIIRTDQTSADVEWYLTDSLKMNSSLALSQDVPYIFTMTMRQAGTPTCYGRIFDINGNVLDEQSTTAVGTDVGSRGSYWWHLLARVGGNDYIQGEHCGAYGYARAVPLAEQQIVARNWHAPIEIAPSIISFIPPGGPANYTIIGAVTVTSVIASTMLEGREIAGAVTVTSTIASAMQYTGSTILIDFEEGDLTDFDSTLAQGASTISAVAEAAIVGSFGLKIDKAVGNLSVYGTKNFTEFSSHDYYVSFWWDPQTLYATGNAGASILEIRTTGSVELIRIEQQYNDDQDRNVRIIAFDDTTSQAGAVKQIGNGPVFIEIEMVQASSAVANDGSFKFFVGGQRHEQDLTFQIFSKDKPTDLWLGHRQSDTDFTAGVMYFDHLEIVPGGTRPDSGEAIYGWVAVTTTIASDTEYNHEQIGDVTIPVTPAATMLEGREIAADVTVTATIASAFDFTLNAAITSDITVLLTIVADLVPPSFTINGAVTIPLTIASALEVGETIAGSVTIGTTISSAVDYTLNASVVGSSEVSAAIAAEMVEGRTIFGDVTVASTVVAAFEFAKNPIITSDITIGLTIASSFAFSVVLQGAVIIDVTIIAEIIPDLGLESTMSGIGTLTSTLTIDATKIGTDFKKDILPLELFVPDEFTERGKQWLQDKLEEIVATVVRNAQGVPLVPVQNIQALYASDQFPIGSQGKFFHPTYGLVSAIFCEFVSMVGTQIGSPVGLAGSQTELQWKVTNDFSASAESAIIGVSASDVIPTNNQFGWVITAGPNLHRMPIKTAETNNQFDLLGWSNDNEISSTATVNFCQQVTSEARDSTFGYNPGELLIAV